MDIYLTKNFRVESHQQPFVSREEGGHVRIFTRQPERVTDRTKFSPQEAVEFVRLSMIVGQALLEVMNEQGIPVVKVNYEDLGNWAFKRGEQPEFHLHVFGRAADAKHQVFPEAVQLPDRASGFYDSFTPLNEADVAKLRDRIEALFGLEQFQDNLWRL